MRLVGFGICRTNREGRVVWANRAYERLLGLRQETARGRLSTALIGECLKAPADDGALIVETLQDKRMGREPAECGPVALNADGGTRFVQIATWPTSSDPHARIETLVDVTDARTEIESLVRANRRMREMFDSSSPAVIVLDRELCLVEANAFSDSNARDDYGAELVRRASFLSNVPEEAHEDFIECFERALLGERFRVERCHRVFNAKEPDWFEFWYVPMVSDHGGIDHVAIHIVRITERKEAEARLAESELRFRTIVQNSSDLVLLLDADLLVRYASPATHALLDLPAEKVTGRPVLSMCHPTETSALRDFLRDLVPGEEHRERIRVRLIHADGPWVYVEGVASQLSSNGGHDVLVTFRDVTARTHLEQQRERYTRTLEGNVADRTLELDRSREELRRSERLASIGTLAAGIAHEINNPLGVILTASQLAQEQMASGGTTASLEEQLSAIVSNVKRASRIVEEVLRFARSESSNKTAIDANVLMRRVADLFREEAMRSHCTLKLDLCASLPKAFANSTQIEQAILNFANNSVEVGGSGTTITFRTFSTSEHCVGLEVADDGPGMAAEEITHIFDPFYTGRPDGTGLGLSLVHRIVTDHNGSIAVDSQPDGGSVFSIRLPEAREGN